jgi:hypothetical protein
MCSLLVTVAITEYALWKGSSNLLILASHIAPAIWIRTELKTDVKFKLKADFLYPCYSDFPVLLTCTEFETSKASGTVHYVSKTSLTVSEKGMLI